MNRLEVLIDEIGGLMEELKPCPFCGSDDLDGPNYEEYMGDVYGPSWWIECNKCPCGLRVVGKTSKLLISAWNRRADGH